MYNPVLSINYRRKPAQFTRVGNAFETGLRGEVFSNMSTFIEDIRKKQIIDTALDIINERGSAAISIGDIAKKAGVSKGVVTYYFKTKDVIIRYVIIRIIQIAADFFMKEVEKKRNYRDKIITYASTCIKYWIENHKVYESILQLWSCISSPAEKENFNKNIVRATVTYVSGLLAKGVKSGEFNFANINETALLIQSTIDGVLLYWSLNNNIGDINTIIQMVISNINMIFTIDQYNK